jgi:hypothetical protein
MKKIKYFILKISYLRIVQKIVSIHHALVSRPRCVPEDSAVNQKCHFYEKEKNNYGLAQYSAARQRALNRE